MTRVASFVCLSCSSAASPRSAVCGGQNWIWTAGHLDVAEGAQQKPSQPHMITLPPAAIEIIQSVPRRSRDQLFGDRSARGFTEWHRAKLKLNQKLAGAVKPWQLRDIRRSVATHMADDVGIEPHHVEAVLNHYSGRGGVAGVYNRARYEIAIASALRRWSEHLFALLEGGRESRESNVISLQLA